MTQPFSENATQLACDERSQFHATRKPDTPSEYRTSLTASLFAAVLAHGAILAALVGLSLQTQESHPGGSSAAVSGQGSQAHSQQDVMLVATYVAADFASSPPLPEPLDRQQPEQAPSGVRTIPDKSPIPSEPELVLPQPSEPEPEISPQVRKPIPKVVSASVQSDAAHLEQKPLAPSAEISTPAAPPRARNDAVGDQEQAHQSVEPPRGAQALSDAGAQALDQTRQKIRHEPPVYPPRARRQGQEGTVVLKLLVLSDGKVADVQVVSSSGHRLLDSAALDAVRKWRFSVRQTGSQWLQAPVVFRLQ